jgi:hypothetical protein
MKFKKGIVIVTLLLIVFIISSSLPLMATGGVPVEDARCNMSEWCSGSARCNSPELCIAAQLNVKMGSLLHCKFSD